MKTYSSIDNSIGKWVETDATCPGLPPWSCFCILPIQGIGIKEYHAEENCAVCLGYGVMPIPPSELEK